MKRLLVLSAATALSACQSPVPIEAAAVTPKANAWKIVQDPTVGFVFCDHRCPEPTSKMLYVAVDLAADDPRQKVLARLRAQMTGKGTEAGPSPDVRAIASSGNGRSGGAGQGASRSIALTPSATGGNWVMYAIPGSASDARILAAITELVRSTPGARFHVFAGAEREQDAQETAALIRRLGVPAGAVTQFALQRDHGIDAQITAALRDEKTAATDAGPMKAQLLVIKE